MAAICLFNSPYSTYIALLLVVFLMFSSQCDSRLLDPTRLGQELQTFANDALGVSEMQVRNNELGWVRIH